MSHKVCFVIMPFSDRDTTGENKWDDLFEHNIKPAVEEAGLGYNCIRSINVHGNFMQDIVNRLATAEIVIAVLTELRPNVMYKLGIRNALRRKTIMLAESMNDVPSDLTSFIALEYSTKTENARKTLKETIQHRLSILDSEEPKSDNPVSDYLKEQAQELCDDWHENKNPQTLLPRLAGILPSYALKLEPILSKVSLHIKDIEERATENAKKINLQQQENTTSELEPEVQKEAEAVALAGEALREMHVNLTPAILSNMAYKAVKEGNYKEAIECYNTVIALDPNDEAAWYNRGTALYDLNRYQEAVESYDKAIALDPSDAGTWSNRGAALRRLNCYQEAVGSYDQAITIDPKNGNVWYNRGITLGELHRYQEAIESYDKAIALDCQRANVWGQRAYHLFFLKDFDGAQKSFGQAITLDPQNEEYINNRGFVLEAMGRIEEALKCYQQTLSLNKNHPHALYNRGSALKKLGRVAEGEESIRKALTIDPQVGEMIEAQKRAVGL